MSGTSIAGADYLAMPQVYDQCNFQCDRHILMRHAVIVTGLIMTAMSSTLAMAG